jgi:hypothetical protein
MNLEDLLRQQRDMAARPAGELTVRRLLHGIEAEHRRRVASPEALRAMGEVHDEFMAARAALAAGREAADRGELAAAAGHLRVAARSGIGDAAVRLAGVLAKLEIYGEALEWCAAAEHDGWQEAADLAVRCREALGQPPKAAEVPRDTSAARSKPRPVRRPDQPAVSADPGLSRRMKALACTAPLHDLDRHKEMLKWLPEGIYQMAEIGMHTIDRIALAMDFDTGAAHDDVVQRVRPFIAAQAPERPTAEHERIARWVLEKLINVGTVDRVFRGVYGEIDEEGAYQRRLFDFKLLLEVPGPRGGIFLRASDQAINVLVGALDTDVESSQVAAEVKLGNLIDRGQLDDARLAAETARYRTIQFAESLRYKLDATRRDVRMVDWDRALPDLLDKALTHVEERFRVEHAILQNITDQRDQADDPKRKRLAADLVAIVQECIRRHTQLQARLVSARGSFREEQDRQLFSGPPQRPALNLQMQLLLPLLELPIAHAAGPSDVFFRAASGPYVPDAPSLTGLVTMLLRPSADRDRTAGPVADPQLDEAPDLARFPLHLWDRAEELLDLPGEVRELSEILAAAAEFDPNLPALVALLAARACDPAVSAAVANGDNSVLIAVPSGMPIPPSPGIGVLGDDLLLTTAKVVDLETHEKHEGIA